jgi:hypothetical protein
MTMMSRLAIAFAIEANGRSFRSNSRNDLARTLDALVRTEILQYQCAMGPVLLEQGSEIGQQLLGRSGWKSMAAKPCDQFLLVDDVSFTLGNMIINHLQVSCRVGHGCS